MEVRIKITDDMAKAEELAIVECLTEVFNQHPNNYLHSFFTPVLQGFLSNAIRDDICPTVDHYIDGSVQSEKDEEISDLRRELEGLRKTFDKVADDNLALAERARKAEAVEKDRVTDLIEQLNASHNREENLQRDLDYLEVQVRDLKAEIYDLERRKV